MKNTPACVACVHGLRCSFFFDECDLFSTLSVQHEKVQMRKELWRIEDVIAGLSSSKANYQVTISSVTNPG